MWQNGFIHERLNMNNGKFEHKPDIQKWRMIALYIVIAGVFVFFGIRLFSLQIVYGQNYLARADSNRTNTISVATQRGIIFDRNGTVLARNVPSYNVVIT